MPIFEGYGAFNMAGFGGLVDWWAGDFYPRLVWQYSSVEIDYEIFFDGNFLRWFKKGSCQLLAEECVHVLINCLED